MNKEKTFYYEAEGQIQEAITDEQMAVKVEAINMLMKSLGFKNLRGLLKENPTYDSAGNVWD